MPIGLAVILRSKLRAVMVDSSSFSGWLLVDRQENEREMALVVCPWGRLDDVSSSKYPASHRRHSGQATAPGGVVLLLRAGGGFAPAPLGEGDSDLQAP